MDRALLQRFVFFLARLLGLWSVTDDMPPDQIAEKALKKWKTSSAALAHLLQIGSPSTNVLLASCLLWSSVELGNPSPDLPTLQKLLEELPAQVRAETFQRATNSDTDRAAYLLLQLLPSALPGLAPVAKKIAEQWTTTGRERPRRYFSCQGFCDSQRGLIGPANAHHYLVHYTRTLFVMQDAAAPPSPSS